MCRTSNRLLLLWLLLLLLLWRAVPFRWNSFCYCVCLSLEIVILLLLLYIFSHSFFFFFCFWLIPNSRLYWILVAMCYLWISLMKTMLFRRRTVFIPNENQTIFFCISNLFPIVFSMLLPIAVYCYCSVFVDIGTFFLPFLF